MSLWKELCDDFTQALSQYPETIKLTPPQVMRYIVGGYSEFQRRTMIVENQKTLIIEVGDDVTSDGARFPCIDDMLEIRTLEDVNGKRLLQVSLDQHRDIIERSLTGIGYHETPIAWSNIREREGAAITEWENSYGGGHARIYTLFNENLYRYPAESTDTLFTMRYIRHIDPFTAQSTQWSAFFPLDTAFEAAYSGTGPDRRIAKYESAFVWYALMTWYIEKNVLLGEQPTYKLWQERFEQIVMEAIDNKPIQTHELQAPYNIAMGGHRN